MKLLISIIPVLTFLVMLIFLDSFKLVKFQKLIFLLFLGILAAALSYLINILLNNKLQLTGLTNSIYFAPILEEVLKCLILVFFIRIIKIGFTIDTAIYGFAIGCGFSIFENILYFSFIKNENLLLWIFRGFGTAIMHSGTVAIFGIIYFFLKYKKPSLKSLNILLAISVPFFLHLFYNHFYLQPVYNVLFIILLVSITLFIAIYISDNYLRNWLEIELNTEAELVLMISNGKFSNTSSGNYFLLLKEKFNPEIIFDMLCYVKLYLEMSIRAKGILLSREAGFKINKDPETEIKLNEIKHLEKNIGKTGLVAISPVLRFNKKELWKINLLND